MEFSSQTWIYHPTRETILCAIAMADVGGGWHGALELTALVWQRPGAPCRHPVWNVDRFGWDTGTPLLQSRAQAARTSAIGCEKTKLGGTERSGSDNWEMSFDWICHGYGLGSDRPGPIVTQVENN
jgi:hypothetical protein